MKLPVQFEKNEIVPKTSFAMLLININFIRQKV